MPKYEITLEVRVTCFVEAHNKAEAEEIVLSDTEQGIASGIELGGLMGIIDSIDPINYHLESGEPSYSCPNCDAWGYDVKKSFCSICDAEEDEEDTEEE